MAEGTKTLPKNFKYILEQANNILRTDQGVFFGVDHDDIFFHEYLATIIFNLSSTYKIHLLLETPDSSIQKSLSKISSPIKDEAKFNARLMEIKASIAKQNEGRPLKDKIQPVYLVPLLANECGVNVKGIDVTEDEINAFHASKLGEAEKRVSQGEAMVTHVKNELSSRIKDDKYIILGGYMHGDLPRKLSIQSINVFENTLLKEWVSSVQGYAPQLKLLASDETLKPNHVFFYDASEVESDKIRETKITTEPASSPSSGWMPAFSISINTSGKVEAKAPAKAVAATAIVPTEKATVTLTPMEIAVAANNTGIKMLRERRFSEAEECFRKVLAYWETQPTQIKEMQATRFNLGSALFERGKAEALVDKLRESEAHLLEAFNIQDKGGNKADKYETRLAACRGEIGEIGEIGLKKADLSTPAELSFT